MSEVRAFIGLGSNLDKPHRQVETAVAEVDALPRTRVTAHSPWYRSAPLGPPGQPDYINGVVAILTELAPETLLEQLQAIEDRHGRRRHQRWGARTLDLDILLYGNLTRSTAELTLPHPELAARNFVLYPLADLAPDLRLPDGTPLASLLANVDGNGIVRLSKGD